MSVEFYHLQPVILTDDLFFALQPTCAITGTALQRSTAFTIAEQQMIDEIGTPLLPTVVTGTYMFPLPYEPIVLEFNRVHSIRSVVGLALDDACQCDLSEYEGCGIIRDQYGYIDTRVLSGAVRACACGPGNLYQLRVAFEAGLPTGTAANDSGLHLGLAMAAAQVLREISDPGSNEGGPGAPGLKSWAAQGYSESRVDPEKTAFGENALGTFIRGLVEHLRIKRALKL